MKGLMQRLHDERGVSAVIVAVSLIGLFGAAVLAIDAGSAWATRRHIVTSTDAAALAAARLYASGLANPCTVAGETAGEAESTSVLKGNAAKAEPLDYEVTVSGCPDHPVGHVRVDARLGSKQAFSGIFGFDQTKPFSSSTAEFGYLIGLGKLRPIAICDQATLAFPNQPSATPPGPADSTGAYPHYALWNWLRKGKRAGGPAPYDTSFTQTDYNRYWGTHATEYPAVSIVNPDSINNGKTYLPIAAGGGVVHRINAKDTCGGGASWRGWVDLNGTGGPGSGSGTADLADWLEEGFDGTVNLGDPVTGEDPACPEPGGSEDCSVQGGNHNAKILDDALNAITCPATQTSEWCKDNKYVFPIILDNGVTAGPPGDGFVNQIGFLYVIMRGWGSGLASDSQPCNGNDGCVFDLEFINIQEQGKIGNNPSGNDDTPRGTALCGVDHDTQENRCNV
jgi:hypothetical protein